jgi:hypothetical protein
LDSKALFKDQSYTISGGSATGDLPTDFMFERWVTYKGIALKPITRAELNGVSGDDWSDDTGDPLYYLIDPEEATKQIRVYPYPPTGDAGGTLVMRYFPLPADLSNGSDVPLNSSALMAQFHVGLAAWMAWLLMANDPSTPAKVKKREDLLSMYNDSVSVATDTFKNTASAPLLRRVVR